MPPPVPVVGAHRIIDALRRELRRFLPFSYSPRQAAAVKALKAAEQMMQNKLPRAEHQEHTGKYQLPGAAH